MSNLVNIDAALVQAYLAVGLGLPTAYENKDFAPPSANWASVSNHPAGKNPVTLGDGGEDNTSGYFQIDLHTPENKGRTALLGLADTVLGYFFSGQRFQSNGQVVTIRRSSLSPIHKDDQTASFVLSVSVYWDSRSNRPT